MILALVTPYVSVVVVVLLWAFSLRPVLRAIHAGPESRTDDARRLPRR